jgi:phage-related tail protein
MRLVKAMNTSNFAEIKTVKKEMALMYDTAKKQTEEIDKMLDGIFESAEDVIDSISDMTSTIAESLSSALAEGLTQSDFLEQMKDYIRKMLIQSLVYTETLKSEIASIGEAISKGITEGFTETSLHEIRRDLSWTFDQANRTLSKIDEVMNNVFSGGYATGTNNATRGVHLVGELGPELVNFRGGEQVLNNRNTQTALENAGGTTINQNVVFNNLQDTSAFAMMSQLRQYNREMAINGII